MNYTTAPLERDLHAERPDQRAACGCRRARATPSSACASPTSRRTGPRRELSGGWLAASFRKLDRQKSRRVRGKLLQPWHPFTRESVLPVEAGEPMRLDVEVFPVNAVIQKGHSLRVSVNPSDFPHAVPPLPQFTNSLAGRGPGAPRRRAPVVGDAADARPLRQVPHAAAARLRALAARMVKTAYPCARREAAAITAVLALACALLPAARRPGRPGRHERRRVQRLRPRLPGSPGRSLQRAVLAVPPGERRGHAVHRLRGVRVAITYMNSKPEWQRYLEVWPLDTGEFEGNNLGRKEFTPNEDFISAGLPTYDARPRKVEALHAARDRRDRAGQGQEALRRCRSRSTASSGPDSRAVRARWRTS